MNHFLIKLMNYGLTFHNLGVRIRVQDLILPTEPIPIVWSHRFKPWIKTDSDEDIGTATLFTENFNLWADCQFRSNLIMSQPSKDKILIQPIGKRMISMNSLSILVHQASIEKSIDNEYAPDFIKNARIINLSPVIDTANPGEFIFGEPLNPSKSYNNPDYITDKYIIFTGDLVNKNILD